MTNWAKEHPEKMREYKRKWRERNRETENLKARERYAANPRLFKDRIQRSREKCPGRHEAIHAKNRRKYLDARIVRSKTDPVVAAKKKAADKAYRFKNKERLRERDRLKVARLVRTNLNYAIRKRLRNRIFMALNGDSKSGNTVELLGCSIPDFKIYIESKFDSGMTWDNWGKGNDKWNLDHIMPCAIFDLSKPEHQKRCFHFSNYQPLWESENLAKADKCPDGHQFDLL